MGNCIGARNEKYFFIFLTTGTIVAWTASISSIFHVIFSLCTNDFTMLKLLFTNHLQEMIVIIIVITIASLLESVGFRYKTLTYGSSIISLLYYIWLFYKENANDFMLINPISVIVIIVMVPLSVFVNVFFVKQFNLVTRKLTYKQLNSILKEQEKLKLNEDEAYFRVYRQTRGKLSIKEKFSNIMNFIKKERPGSLFDEEYSRKYKFCIEDSFK